jgi:hypothetical protein
LPVDIHNLNKPAKFFYPGSKKKEWIEFRTIPMSRLREWRKETITPKVEYHKVENINKPFRYESEDVDDDKLFELMWDYQIYDWNIKDTDNKPIECNKENKLLLISNSLEFSEFALSSIKKLGEDEVKRREKSEKN